MLKAKKKRYFDIDHFTARPLAYRSDGASTIVVLGLVVSRIDNDVCPYLL